MSAKSRVIVSVCLIVLINSQCPIGEGHDDQGECVPCNVQHCGFCSGSNSITCDACIAPYVRNSDGTLCSCPQGQGPMQNGGCRICSVLNCGQCSNPYDYTCQACLPNFSNKKTDNGIQCICQAPYTLNEYGQCTCPPGQGYDKLKGCAPCKVTNCQICSTSSNSTCTKCFSTARLSQDGASCACALGEGPTMGMGCSPCRPENCARCDNAVLDRCAECKPNFAKVVTSSKTTCVCADPFIITTDGECVCPPGEGPDGKGGCTSCSADNCLQCVQEDYTSCEVCLPTYVLNEDGSKCVCPNGYGKTIGGDCQPCQVSNCKSCQDAGQNMCSICHDNFINVITGASSECVCKSPFILTETGQCRCPLGQGQDGVDKCIPCSVNNCDICPDPTQDACDVCKDTYVMTFDPDGLKCKCPPGFGPLNGGNCDQCADSNCRVCNNSALSVCQLCRANYTNVILSYDNVTNTIQSSQCICNNPFILNETGSCVCPAGTTLNDIGLCQACGVKYCSNCESKQKKCSSCFEPFVLSNDGKSCVCPLGQVQEQGSCVPCTVTHCVKCNKPNEDTCDLCDFNYTLTTQKQAVVTENSTSTDASAIETAICSCDEPFIYYPDSGKCTCPEGLMLDGQGGCKPCSVDNCAQCSSPYVCQACQAPFSLNQDQSRCSCPKGQGLTQSGQCGDCFVDHCEVCFHSYSQKCFSCSGNFTLSTVSGNDGTQTQECLCNTPFVVDKTTLECVCPVGYVYNGNGGCDVCEVYNCVSCPSNNVTTCNQCLSPFILTEDNMQCGCPSGSGPSNGQCVTCQDTNCVHCPLAPAQCFICASPFVLDQNGNCVCPPGYVSDQYGICSKCVVNNCDKCQTASATTCLKCNGPSKLSYDATRCECPYGQSKMPGGGCAPCSVKNCQQCENALISTCIECKPSFNLNADETRCSCQFGQGPSTEGYCQPCRLDFCTECYRSSYTCSVCEPPYVSNSQGTACVCPVGQGPNGQYGCAKCQVSNCAICGTSSQNICDQCLAGFELSQSGDRCYFSDINQKACVSGQGINSDGQCDYCSVPFCEKCYGSLDTCSICQSPFISNSDGTQCVCPRGQASNGAGGCSYCTVENCESCSSSQALVCDTCFYPFQLVNAGLFCQEPHKDVFDRLSDAVSKPFGIFNMQQMDEKFGTGILTGVAITLGVVILVIAIYYCCKKNHNNNNLMSEPQTARTFYSQMQLPSNYKNIAGA